jgi:glycosyltransferase involved in cell wall biosynthesis
VRKTPAGLEVDYDGFTQSGLLEMGEDAQCLGGRRRVRFRVEGRTLRAEEELHFDEMPHAVALQVAETRGRPLRVDFACPAPHRASVVDTDGLAEYRSFWAELPRVHQVDVEPARAVRLAWSVTPLLRVASTEHEHHYHRSLYDALAGRVLDVAFPRQAPGSPALAREHLRHVDFFHLHWPEWLWGPDPEVHRRLIGILREAEVRILWTQHNLVPHRKDDRYATIYDLWAGAADAAIHHSRWGEAQARERFRFGPHTIHRVIPHGHFGNLLSGTERAERAAVEAELGLPPCAARIGVIGAPRVEKKTQMLMDAFAAACPREDFQLLVLALGPDDVVPDDPRIHAIPFPGQQAPRDVFNRRLGTLDVLAIPIEGGDYLTTGQFADAVGLGIPALVSDWPFLVEMLGDAAIVYGRGREALERCLAGLDPERIERAAAACRARQAELDWARSADRTLALMEEVGTARL